MRILLIEDELKLANVLSKELLHEGYDVTIKINGKEGLEEALLTKYDLIILDVMLPEMNGHEVCRRLKKEKDTPIIMLTARDTVIDKVTLFFFFFFVAL